MEDSNDPRCAVQIGRQRFYIVRPVGQKWALFLVDDAARAQTAVNVYDTNAEAVEALHSYNSLRGGVTGVQAAFGAHNALTLAAMYFQRGDLLATKRKIIAALHNIELLTREESEVAA